MDVWLASLIGGLVSAAGSAVGRVLLALGISYVSYSGLDALLDWVTVEFKDAVTGAPVSMAQVMGLLQLDTCFSIIMSALIARLILKGLTGGLITKMVIGG